MQTPHRKRIKHFYDAGHLHELTFNCYRRMTLRTNNLWRAMSPESIDRATQPFQTMCGHHLIQSPASTKGMPTQARAWHPGL